MGATAQFDRSTGFEHAHDVAVLVAEEGDRAERLGLVLRGLEDARRAVAERLGVRDTFDFWICSARDRVVVREVEPQPIGTDHGTGLLHVVAEHVPQRVVQQVGGGVVATDRVAALASMDAVAVWPAVRVPAVTGAL